MAETPAQAAARERLDAHVRDIVRWHFDPATGCPFWLERARTFAFDPMTDVNSYADLDKFGFFEDEWLRGGPVRRWVPKAYANSPVYTFETGGSTGVPKSRIAINDFRIDYERFSETLPDASFPKGSDWLMVGPSGPRRLRLAIEHLAQHRGGICFMVDLDPRWVIKLIKARQMDQVEAYKRHVIDQALTLLRAHDNIQCLFTTPKLLEALCERVSLKKMGIKGVFCGGTEMTPQFHRFAVEELLDGIYFAPTYGNTLMGLATHKDPRDPADNFAIIYYPPAPRAMIEVVDPDRPDHVVDYGKTGRVRLTTLTKEFFMPRFLERDEAERERPCERYPWDGVRNVRPFSRFATTVVEGVDQRVRPPTGNIMSAFITARGAPPPRALARRPACGRLPSGASLGPQALALLLIFIGVVPTSAQWPQWRGPNRDGVVPAASVPAAWPEKLALKWRQPIGEGYSSPVVADGRVFVHSRADPDEIVTAFDLSTGKPVWTARYGSAFKKNQYASAMSKGPFSTPLVANGRVFTLGTSAVLSSFDAATGELKWRKDWSKEIDTSKLFTGTAMSPIVEGGLLVVHVGDDSKGAFRAFDPMTGVEKWSIPGHGPGYASPVVRTIGGTRHLITMTDRAVVGIDVTRGALLWQIPFPDEWNENIVTPTMAGEVLVISGTRKGTFGYRIEKTGSSWSPKQAWQNADLPMYMSSPVADGTLLYGFSSKRKGQLFCLDAATGVTKWTTEGRGGTNVALQSVGDNLIVLTTDGDLLVVKRNPARYEELRRYKVGDSATWGHPVLAGGAIVIRDAASLAAWSLK